MPPIGRPQRSRWPTTRAQRQPSPSPLLRNEFDITAPVASARLYVTSLGVFQMFVNGAAVSDELLSPGWSTYGKRIVANTYDVTDLLRVGKNSLGGILGDGWYRGTSRLEPRQGPVPLRDRARAARSTRGHVREWRQPSPWSPTIRGVPPPARFAAPTSTTAARSISVTNRTDGTSPDSTTRPGARPTWCRSTSASWSRGSARRSVRSRRSRCNSPRPRTGSPGSTSVRTSPVTSRSRFAERQDRSSPRITPRSSNPMARCTCVR